MLKHKCGYRSHWLFTEQTAALTSSECPANFFLGRRGVGLIGPLTPDTYHAQLPLPLNMLKQPRFRGSRTFQRARIILCLALLPQCIPIPIPVAACDKPCCDKYLARMGSLKSLIMSLQRIQNRIAGIKGRDIFKMFACWHITP